MREPASLKCSKQDDCNIATCINDTIAPVNFFRGGRNLLGERPQADEIRVPPGPLSLPSNIRRKWDRSNVGSNYSSK